MGLGRLGCLPCGRLGGRLCLVGLFSRVGLACLVIGVGDTPVVLLLPACVGSGAWWVPPRACVCVGGMLSGFWGSAPWLPGLSGAPDLLGGSGWVWVGWL